MSRTIRYTLIYQLQMFFYVSLVFTYCLIKYEKYIFIMRVKYAANLPPFLSLLVVLIYYKKIYLNVHSSV
jgi:hypothetical protein